MPRRRPGGLPLDPVEAFERFHWGEAPDQVLGVTDRRYDGETLVLLGAVTGLRYLAAKGGELVEWDHDFDADDPPLLALDEDGNLVLLGGGYVVDERGIVG